MTQSSCIASAWVRRFGSLRDPGLRIGYARHELMRLTKDALLDLIVAASAGAEAGSEGHRDLLRTIFIALAHPEMAELRRQASEGADQRGEPDLARSLREHDHAPKEQAPVIPDAKGGRPLTLGERKALARGADRLLIARVLRDPEPVVIRILLGNPALTEEDVVRLSARRPIRPQVLREVFLHRRWSVRYRVQLALVRNPHCPRDLAMQLACQLRRQDAREVAASSELPEEVRRAALRSTQNRTLH